MYKTQLSRIKYKVQNSKMQYAHMMMQGLRLTLSPATLLGTPTISNQPIM